MKNSIRLFSRLSPALRCMAFDLCSAATKRIERTNRRWFNMRPISDIKATDVSVIENILGKETYVEDFRLFLIENDQLNRTSVITSLYSLLRSNQISGEKILKILFRYFYTQNNIAFGLEIIPFAFEFPKIVGDLIKHSNIVASDYVTSDRELEILILFLADAFFSEIGDWIFTKNNTNFLVPLLLERLEEKRPVRERLAIHLTLLDKFRRNLTRGEEDKLRAWLLNDGLCHYASMDVKMKMWYWKVVFEGQIIDEELKDMMKLLPLDTIEDLLAFSSFAAGTLINIPVAKAAPFWKRFIEFRIATGSWDAKFGNPSEGLEQLDITLMMLRFLKKTQISSEQRMKCKSLVRCLEGLAIRMSEEVLLTLKDSRSLKDSVITLHNLFVDIFKVYTKLGSLPPKEFFNCVDILLPQIFPLINNVYFSELSEVALDCGNLETRRLYLEESTKRAASFVRNRSFEFDIKSILFNNKIFTYSYTGVDVTPLLDVLDQAHSFFDLRSNLRNCFLGIVNVMLLEERYDSKVLKTFISNFNANLIYQNELAIKFYLMCKALYNPPEISMPVEEIKQIYASHSYPKRKDYMRSHLQTTFEETLTRNNIRFICEENIYGFSVDLFIRPNIVIEVLGEFHLKDGFFDKHLLRKIRVLRKLGYKIILVNHSEAANHELRIQVIEKIKELQNSQEK